MESTGKVQRMDLTDRERRFEELVAEALDGLPDWVAERLDNVEVLIEELPPSRDRGLLGVYEGIPLTKRGLGYAGVMPDRITLFRGNIEHQAFDEASLKRVIRHTVVHEIAHFFGISDERLLEIDRY
jgi:predicted Zn-dependent protease with MMP-like domain